MPVFPRPLKWGAALSLGTLVSASTLPAVALPQGAIAQLHRSFPWQLSQAEPDVVIDSEPQPGGNPAPLPTQEDVRFSCELMNGQYTVAYRPISQPDQAYPWAVPRQLGGGWNPQRRCETIAQRLETYRPDGLMDLMVGTENGYDTVCATTLDNPECRIVFTVPPGQDPYTTRDRVFENLALADSGLQTEGVATFGDRGSPLFGGSRRDRSINLRPFLDPADGGTGTQLRSQPETPQPQPRPRFPWRLNPEIFR